MAEPTLAKKIHNFAAGKLGQVVAARNKGGYVPIPRGNRRVWCWDLAEQAVRTVGAKGSHDFVENVTRKGRLVILDGNGDYVWGKEVVQNKTVPGDVAQFRDHIVKTVTQIKTTFKYSQNGGTVEFTEVFKRQEKRGHHTEIVSSLDKKNGMLTVFEQHVKGSSRVQKNTLRTRGRTSNTSNTYTTMANYKQYVLGRGYSHMNIYKKRLKKTAGSAAVKALNRLEKDFKSRRVTVYVKTRVTITIHGDIWFYRAQIKQ